MLKLKNHLKILIGANTITSIIFLIGVSELRKSNHIYEANNFYLVYFSLLFSIFIVLLLIRIALNLK